MKTNLRGPESNGVRNVAIDQLLQIIEFTDDGHSLRTADLVSEMLRSMGLSGSPLGEIALAARLHDVGKRFVNPRILDKPGPLDVEERSEMEQHVWRGFRSLKHRAQPLPAICTQVALLHHERLDGSGYPFKLSGSAVPFAPRVVAVADVYDALVSERPYKQAWPVSAAASYLSQRSGSEFDRRCVSALHSVLGLRHGAVAPYVRPNAGVNRYATDRLVAT